MKKIVKMTIGALIVAGLLFSASHLNHVEKNAGTNIIYVHDPGSGGGGM